MTDALLSPAEQQELRPPLRETIERPVSPQAALLALGIVYGDLGTSPLYALQTVVQISGGAMAADIALGVLSLIIWSLVISISIKYCFFVMRADNHGEGGIMALMMLTGARWHGRSWILIAFGLFGAALIYGDGIITPAISVLSAVEGLNVATEAFRPYVMPIAVVILVALFAAQASGTAAIGRAFGPVMGAWFAIIGLLGLIGIVRQPKVLAALDPAYALSVLVEHGSLGFAILGGVFLVMTGGEALYADMGHVGRNPIRMTWYFLVLPALLLNYGGQIGLYLDNPALTGNPFFRLAPGWMNYPLVALATLSTIIASQAIITGSFSMTRQAMQLGWLPGIRIRQTSADEYGQIYVPFVNWTMMALTVALTITFGSSDRLAGAYGTAVATTMVLTTALLYAVMRGRWGWSPLQAGATVAVFLAVDLGFFAANLLKIAEGGWIPLTLAVIIFTAMLVWHGGVEAIRRQIARHAKAPSEFHALVERNDVRRVPGTAVFLTRAVRTIPPIIVDYALRSRALPQHVIALSVQFETVPRVHRDDRVRVSPMGEGLWHVTARFGFVEIPDLPLLLAAAAELGAPAAREATYYVERDEIVSRPHAPFWRKLRVSLFAFMFRNSAHAVDRFKLPSAALVEIGRRLEIE